jgi:hypothetical protein
LDIGIGSLLTAAALTAPLAELLAGCTVSVVDKHEKVPDGVDVLIVRTTNASEFPTGIAVYARLEPWCDLEGWLRELARRLSERLRVRTICDGTPFGESAAPYWSVVWDRGVAFLADDSGTTFGDGSGGPVRIVRPLPPDLFASRPDLVSAVARNSGQRGTDGRDLIR